MPRNVYYVNKILALILFISLALPNASAQEGPNDPPSDPENPPKMGGEAYTAPADYPHVKSQIEIQADQIMKQQQEFLKQQQEVLKKVEEGTAPGVSSGAIPGEEATGEPASPPKQKEPASREIASDLIQCKHIKITMPEDANCGYLITKDEDEKSAKILMIESSNVRKDQCFLEIDCDKPVK